MKPPPPVIKVAKVLELEYQDKVEDMDVVDALREEWLESERMRQLGWAAKMMCKELVQEMV